MTANASLFGSGLPLPMLAKDIQARNRKGDEHYKAAGIHLIEAKERVKARYREVEPGMTWAKFCSTHIPQRSRRSIDFLIASSAGQEVGEIENLAAWQEFSKPDDADRNAIGLALRADRTAKERNQRARDEAATNRVANGGNPARTRRDPEHAALGRRFAEIGRKLSAGDMQIAIKWMEEQFPALVV